MVAETPNADFVVLWGGLKPDGTWLTGIFRATLFHVSVKRQDIKNTAFEEEYVRSTHSWSGVSDLITTTCMPLLEKLASKEGHDFKTVQHFLETPTYSIKLLPADAKVCPQLVSGPKYSSAYDIACFPTDQLLPPHNKPFPASDLKVLHQDASPRAISNRVCGPDGTVMFFKPFLDWKSAQFGREMSILSRICTTGLNEKIRVSDLVGIVVKTEGKDTIGLLLKWIPGHVLADDVCIQAREHHAKWKRQVLEIVHTLHSYDIVWGDVNSCNIMIDDSFNAWAVDFEGGCNQQFTDEKNAETKLGDVQGVQNVFTWLAAQASLAEKK